MKDDATLLRQQLATAVVAHDPVPCTKEPELFFPEDFSGIRKNEYTELAKQLCSQCPVADLCKNYAITAQENYGIWGGTTPNERSNYKRKRSSSY